MFIYLYMVLLCDRQIDRQTDGQASHSWLRKAMHIYAIAYIKSYQVSTVVSKVSKCKKVQVKERIVLGEIHLRTTGRHLSVGSHSVICHPTEVTAPPSPQPPQPGRLVLDLSTP